MTDPFASPSSIPSSDYFKPSSAVGSLLLFKPTGQINGFTFGGSSEPTDVVTTDVTVIDEDDPKASVEYTGSNIGPYGIRKVLVPNINKGYVLARLVKGEKQPGKSAPYVLADPTDADKEKARAFLATKIPEL
jgi:hypothetical protein